MKNKSFTLIELLVVIVIIGILSSVIIISVSDAINKANFAKAQSFSSTVQTELLSDLVSEWTFDEDLGTTAKDTWGNNDGTVSGATYVPKSDNECVYGSCYSFDGSNDYIDCGDFTNYIGKNNLTFSVWVKPLINGIDGSWPYSFSAFMGKAGSGSSGDIHVGYRSDNKVRVYFESLVGGTYFDSVNPIKINDWSFIVVSANSSRISLYVNGKLSNYKDFATNFVINNMHIGHTFYATYFNGLIDDARIYDTPLSSAQIKQEYIAGLNSLLANNNISKEEYNERIEEMSSK
ncbi:MAG: prepilin-type N-terminal cleavage/methylation domain-containing protein [Bacilli bacterium]|nr:prepilin-type N-terminal cleavage/methylation domain-containing protein [Bacilli bacterium]